MVSEPKTVVEPETSEWYLGHKSELIWMLIVLGIALGVSTLLWITSLIAFIRESNKIKSNQLFKILAMTALTISLILSFCAFMVVRLSIIDGKYGTVLVEDLIGMGVFSYGLHCSIVLIIFGLRIIKAFKNTSHAMGNIFISW